MSLVDRFNKIGIGIPQIMLPSEHVSLEDWTVIACDQFSSDSGYWDKARSIIKDSPSTLDLIIPECYLEDGDWEERSVQANRKMEDFVQSGVLRSMQPGFVLVERRTPCTPCRYGLMISIDLESYDFSEGCKSLIRPTEGTIHDRLPPRMNIRRGAILDLPHILLLYNDPQQRVMEAAKRLAQIGEEGSAMQDQQGKNLLYDFELMQQGGHLRGYFLEEDGLEALAEAFESLMRDTDILFAVGDGNHSLAAAKKIWEEKKAAGVPGNHPSRYALVEVENIHDAGVLFHPIHRVLFEVDAQHFISAMKEELVDSSSKDTITVITEGKEELLPIRVASNQLLVEPLQEFIDDYMRKQGKVNIDFIHGDAELRKLVEGFNSRVGILLPDINKSSFFSRIIKVGPYPRKTFSIGEALEKRHYCEARSLV